jgi:hypothetical protein
VNVNHYKWLRCPVVSLFLFSVLGLTGSAASAQTPDQPDANAVSAQAPDPNTVKEIISLQGGKPGEVEIARRRRFLRSLGKWSMAVIGAIALGAATPTEGAAWINRRGG